MTRPRSTLVSVADTPYYHCIGRCVRQAFLCGLDPATGTNFDHRKEFVRKRLALLTETFAIDVCAYALMSNHYHLVLRLAPERAKDWSDLDVILRWRHLYKGPPCITKHLAGSPLDAAEQAQFDDVVALWRQRLTELSWFMRCLNEAIARVANAEDGCTGRFWEGRFKSQALLDEQALLTVMAYVDLNPVRAGLAKTIDQSEFTSGQQRLRAVTTMERVAGEADQPRLVPFVDAMRAKCGSGLPFNLQDYLDLLDTSGRVIHPSKPGAIPESTPRLLSTLGLEPNEWLQTVVNLSARFRLFIGAPHRLRSVAACKGWCWVRGHSAARRLYRRAHE